jgi:NAD(P)-dependent dehydrogenase (short-subunit alcohol dehydrogenase family)
MNKTMVITGAASGLGRALAFHLAEQGNRVCALGRRAEALEELRRACPDRIKSYPVDITCAGAVQQVFAEILNEHARLDVLINNAGVFHTAPFHEESFENIDRIVDTNLKGLMYCTRAALPSMIAQKGGRIINISSVSGINGIPGQAIYGASKHGVQGFADVVAREVREHGVLVTNLCPGGIATPLWGDQNPYPGEKADLIQCEEIVGLVEFLLAQPDHTLYRKLVFFPRSEWHSDD